MSHFARTTAARDRTATRNLALLRKIALNIVSRNTTSKASVRARRKKAAWNDAHMLKPPVGSQSFVQSRNGISCVAPGSHPVAEALERRVPLAEQRRQVPPRAASAASAANPQHRLDKQPVVTAGSARVGGLTETKRLHFLPLRVCQAEPIHGKLLLELESQPTLHGNPDPQQALVDLLTNPRFRRTWTPEQRQQIIIDALRSGMSIERFARMSGLTPSVVYCWRKELAARVQHGQDLLPHDPLQHSAAIPTFAFVHVAPAPSELASRIVSDAPDAPVHDTVEVILTNGRRVRLHVQLDAKALHHLLAVLECSS